MIVQATDLQLHEIDIKQVDRDSLHSKSTESVRAYHKGQKTSWNNLSTQQIVYICFHLHLFSSGPERNVTHNFQRLPEITVVCLQLFSRSDLTTNCFDP